MILRQFLHTDPVAHLLSVRMRRDGRGGGRRSGRRHRALSPAAAEATGMRIRYVIDTHLHADHLSAGRELAEAAGAEYVLFAGART